MNKYPIPASEFVVLICAAALLIGFALPWTEAYFGQALHLRVSGLRLLASGPDVRLLKDTDRITDNIDEGFIRRNHTTYQLVALGLPPYLGLCLVPLAALGAAGLTIRAMREPARRRDAVRQRRILVGLLLLYFVFLYPSYGVSGSGILLCAASAVALLIVAPSADGVWAPWKLDFSNFWR